MDLLTLPPPALPPGTLVPDTSYAGRVYQRPWTFAFLGPDLPRLCHHWFRGSDFFHQNSQGKTLDMTVESGGDTYDLCGSEAYELWSESIIPEVGSGSRRLRARKKYEPVLAPPPGGIGPGVFTGLYQMTEVNEDYHDDLGGFLVLELRNTAPDKRTIWEYRGTETLGAPPHHVIVGGVALSEPVNHETLSGFAESWQRDMVAATTDVFDGGVPLLSYPLTQNGVGQHAAIAVGVALVRESDVEPLPWETGEYDLDGVKVHFEFEARSCMPIVYEESGLEVIGNSIYGSGEARYTLTGLIEEKIWKDTWGIYDEGDAFADPRVPWVESLFFAGAYAEGHGWVARGRFISLGGIHRVVLANDDDVEVLTVEVPAGGTVDYSLPMVATTAAQFNPHLLRIEIPDGEGGWTVLDPGTYATILTTRPDPGARLIHLRQAREGYRWGHAPFEPQDPVPLTPAGYRLYRTKTFVKEARP